MQLIIFGLFALAFGVAVFLIVTHVAEARRFDRNLPAPTKRCIVRNDPAFESGRVGRGVPR